MAIWYMRLLEQEEKSKYVESKLPQNKQKNISQGIKQ
jgi:hypothetical protein